MTTKQALQQKLVELETEINSLFEQIEPLQDRVVSLREQEKEAREQLETLELSGPVSWRYLLEETGTSSSVRANACGKALTEISSVEGCIPGLQTSGYFPNLQQRCVHIGLYKGAPELTAKVAAGLKEILPALKTQTYDVGDDEVEGVLFDIFEEFLSEHGIFRLVVSKDSGKSYITKTTYGTVRLVKDFPTLDEALKYIENNLYYKAKE